MATDIILRSVKAAALTHAEMDQNWQSLAGTVDIHTASATIAVTDQNKIIETDISSGTMTLPTVANAAGTDTDSFRVIVKNINATVVIVEGNGSETIEGALNLSLLQYEAAEFTLDGAGTGWVVASYYGPNLVGITSTPTEINKLDGFTGVVADLNIIAAADAAGVTATEFQYLNGVTSAIQTQIDAKLVIASNLSDLASAATARSNLGVDAAGTDNSTDVTLAGTPNYITIVGQAITRALINLTTHITGTLPLANGGTNATTAAAARTSLDVDQAGTDNSTAVTLLGTGTHRSLSVQALTIDKINLTSGTDVSGTLPYANMTFSNDIVAGDIAAGAVDTSELADQGITEAKFPDHAAGTTYRHYQSTWSYGNATTTYLRATGINFTVPRDGIYRVTFDLTTNNSSAGSAIATIYRNAATSYTGDVAFGTERTKGTPAGTATFTEDLTVNAGDVLTIYVKDSNNNASAVVDEFFVSSTQKMFG